MSRVNMPPKAAGKAANKAGKAQKSTPKEDKEIKCKYRCSSGTMSVTNPLGRQGMAFPVASPAKFPAKNRPPHQALHHHHP